MYFVKLQLKKRREKNLACSFDKKKKIVRFFFSNLFFLSFLGSYLNAAQCPSICQVFFLYLWYVRITFYGYMFVYISLQLPIYLSHVYLFIYPLFNLFISLIWLCLCPSDCVSVLPIYHLAFLLLYVLSMYYLNYLFIYLKFISSLIH